VNNDLRKLHKHSANASAIVSHLQELFGGQTKAAEYEIFKELFNAKMKEDGEVVDHTQRMIGLIQRMKSHEFTMGYRLQMDLILLSLHASFSSFLAKLQIISVKCTLEHLVYMFIAF